MKRIPFFTKLFLCSVPILLFGTFCWAEQENTQSKLLGQVPSEVRLGDCKFSSDNQNFLCVLPDVAKNIQKILVNGKVQREYPLTSTIDLIRYLPQKNAFFYFVISPSAKTQPGKRQARWTSVVNNEEKATYEDIKFDVNVVDSNAAGQQFFLGVKGKKTFVVMDGNEIGAYDEVKNIHDFKIRYSPPEHIAYQARQGSSWLMIINGKVSPAFDKISSLSLSSNDYFNYFVGEKGGKQSVVINGEMGKPYSHVSYPTFSLDNQKSAYVATQGKGDFIVLNGKELESYPEIECPTQSKNNKFTAISQIFVGVEEAPHCPVFSPDGQKIAYGISTNGKWSVLTNGVKGKEYDEILFIAFSPDSQKLAYAARKDQKWRMVVNGEEMTHLYDSISPPQFSPKSNLVYFQAINNSGTYPQIEEWFHNVNDLEYKGIPDTASDPIKPRFSPDGTKIIFSAQENLIIHDGKNAKKYKAAANAQISSDGKNIAYSFTYIEDGLYKQRVEFNGKKSKNYYDEISELNISDKGLVYTARKGEKGEMKENYFIVHGDDESKSFSREEPRILFNQEGNYFFRGERGEKYILGSQQGEEEYDMAYPFEVDSKMQTIISKVVRNKKYYLWRNGKESKAYDYIFGADLSPQISLNGKHVAFVTVPEATAPSEGIPQGKRRVVLDEKEGEEYDEIGPFHFSSDQKYLEYIARKGNEVWWISEAMD